MRAIIFRIRPAKIAAERKLNKFTAKPIALLGDVLDANSVTLSRGYLRAKSDLRSPYATVRATFKILSYPSRDSPVDLPAVILGLQPTTS